MSDTDSFIDEVSEEVRKDRLYGYAKRYGWVVAVGLIAIVGGTAYFEYQSAQKEAAAQKRGDAILSALEQQDDAARMTALQDLADQDSSVITRLLAADGPDAAADLQAIANDADQPDHLRDLVLLRLAAMPDALPLEERLTIFDRLAAPGGLYRTPALDYLVLVQIENDQRDAALTRMQEAIQDAATDRAQANRFVELIIAMGETPELASPAATDTQN